MNTEPDKPGIEARNHEWPSGRAALARWGRYRGIARCICVCTCQLSSHQAIHSDRPVGKRRRRDQFHRRYGRMIAFTAESACRLCRERRQRIRAYLTAVAREPQPGLGLHDRDAHARRTWPGRERLRVRSDAASLIPTANPPWVKLALVSSFLAAGFTAAIVIVVASRSSLPKVFRRPVSIPLIVGLLASLPLAASYLQRPSMWPMALWLFFGAGFGEEVFYRGYIQSRVDQSFGRPCRWHGFEFGMGLLISSLLFGLLHVLNTVDYFHGRFDIGWRMGMQSRPCTACSMD